VAFLGLASVGALLVARPEQWLVEHVVIEGQHHATTRELRHLADVPNGTTVWRLDLGAVARGVERHPWVRSAEARFEWPDTVRITVQEHVPVALLRTARGLMQVDEQGEPFLAASVDDLDHPYLTGFGPELDALHPELSTVAIRDALRLLTALDERGLVGRSEVSEVAFDPDLGFTVFAGPARISFGPADLSGQLDRLAALVAAGLSLRSPTSVDLAPATVAVVRPLLGPVGSAGAPPAPSPGG
jgi:cell division protein FtsQ